MTTNPPQLVEFPEVNVVIAKDQPEYRPLPCHRVPKSTKGEIICCWQLDWKARIKVLFTGKLWHSVWTFNDMLQPQLLLCDKPKMNNEKE